MSNPALTSETFRAVGRAATANDVMTLGGTILKTCALLAILLGAGAVGWYVAVPPTGGEAFGPLAIVLAIGGSLGGFVLAMVTIFNPRLSPITAPFYAAAEGLLLGVVSAMFEQMFKGLVMQAVLLTTAVLAAMLFLYATRIIQPTRYFVLGVTAATCGIALFYLVAMVLSLFNFQPELMRQMLYGNSWLGIGFSLFVCGIAALNLVLDFNLIEQGAAYGAPKYMEWYGGFSLLVTLVWLYLEVLRLLAKMRSR